MRSWCLLWWCSLSLLLSLWIVPAANAQKPVILYRCTDARGVVTLQNDMPCPKGSQQEKRTVEAVSAAPFPTPLPPTPAATPARAEPATTAPASSADANEAAKPEYPTPLPLPPAQKPPAERLPPPPLYQCNTVENDSYLSDTPDPKPRCVGVNTVGIDGSQQLGAGQACNMVYDQCQRIPDAAACPAWRKRVNEAQAAWTFGRADSIDALKGEYERIARVVAETTCSQ